MKKLSTHIKYTVFSFTLIIVSFCFAEDAKADTYIFNCADNSGFVASDVNLAPGPSPYVFGADQSFTVSGQITSTCDTHVRVAVTLKVQNNSDPVFNLINTDEISIYQPAILPTNGVPATTTFTAPSTAGTYLVHFTTSIEQEGQGDQAPGGGGQDGGQQNEPCDDGVGSGCDDNQPDPNDPGDDYPDDQGYPDDDHGYGD